MPLQGASVSLMLTMIEMEMEPVTVSLPPINPPMPGTYQARG